MSKTQIQSKIITEINRLHGIAISSVQSAMDAACRIGELLLVEKATLPHGEWGPWVKTNLPFGVRQAQNYTRVFKHQPKTKSSAHLTEAILALAVPIQPRHRDSDEFIPEITPLKGVDAFVKTMPLKMTNFQKQVDAIVDAVDAVGDSCLLSDLEKSTTKLMPSLANLTGKMAKLRIAEDTTTLLLAKPKIVHVGQSTGEREWFTPPEYIEAARKVMGSIDVDPASCDEANKTVKATCYYTAENDGLKQKWKGTVWLNPPYDHPIVDDFCQLLVEKVETEEVSQACLIVNNITETAAGQTVLGKCNAICFPKGRVKFFNPTKTAGNSPLQGQMVLYFGDNADKFCSQFAGFGVCFHGH